MNIIVLLNMLDAGTCCETAQCASSQGEASLSSVDLHPRPHLLAHPPHLQLFQLAGVHRAQSEVPSEGTSWTLL